MSDPRSFVWRERRTCAEEHTPGQPPGYVSWFDWAAEMHAKGYVQRRCEGCGRFMVWEIPHVVHYPSPT